MRRKIGISIITAMLILLMFYSGATRPSRETRLYDLKTNPNDFEDRDVFVTGTVSRSSLFDNDTVDVFISSESGKYGVLLSVDPSLLNVMPKQGDTVEAKGRFTISGAQPHIEVNLIHVRTTWGQRFIYLRSLIAIPIILYSIRQGWDLVRG